MIDDINTNTSFHTLPFANKNCDEGGEPGKAGNTSK